MRFIRLIVINFWFVLNVPQATADPSVFGTFKGLDKVIKDPKYNPISGVMAADYLKGIRYNGNYAPQDLEKNNKLLKCNVKNIRHPHTQQMLPDNCPQDVVTSLIQWLFINATMDGNFAPNRRDPEFKDLVSRFKPATIGRILNEVAKAEGNYASELVNNIINVIVEDYVNISQNNQKTTPESLQKKYETRFNKISSNKESPYKKFEDVLQAYSGLSIKERNQKKEMITNKADLKKVDLALSYFDKVEKLGSQKTTHVLKSRKIDPGYQEQADLFAQIVVAALKKVKSSSKIAISEEKIEEKKEENIIERATNLSAQLFEDEREIYYPNIVEMALLYFGWKISTNKSDLVNLLSAMSSVVEAESLKLYATSDAIYTKTDYLNLINNFKSLKSLTLEQAGLAGFGHRYFEARFPAKISYDKVSLFKNDFDSNVAEQEQGKYLLKNNKNVRKTYSDCVETFIRNILMFLLFDPITKTFDVKKFSEKASSKNIKIDEKIINFFSVYNTMDLATTYAARANWARITSFLIERNVKYCAKIEEGDFSKMSPVCELETGIINLMAILSAFLGQTYKLPHNESDLIDMSPLDTFLALASTADKKWSYKTGNGVGNIPKKDDNYIDVDFYYDGNKIFTWENTVSHADVSVYVKTPENKLIRKSKVLKCKGLLPVYIPLFIEGTFVPNLYDFKLSAENRSLLFYSRYLNNVQTALAILKIIAQDPHKNFVGLGKRLIDSLRSHEGLRKEIIASTQASLALSIYVMKAFEVKYPLRYAIKNSNLELVRFLFEKEENSEPDEEGNTLLHLVAKMSPDSHIADYLLKEGKFNINDQNRYGKTALHFAIENENAPITDFLIKNKADLNIKDNGGSTALNLFTKNKDLVDYYYLWAAQEGLLDILKLMIIAGANTSSCNEDGKTATELAQIYKHEDILNYLEEYTKESMF